MHSHFLPGIDDGAQNVMESEALILGLKDIGFSKFITTPHIFQDYYPNDQETINDSKEKLLNYLNKTSKTSSFKTSAEYFADEHFREKIDSNEDLLTFGKRNILFEVSTLAPSPIIKNIIFDLLARSYQPVLAHPERYIYYNDKREYFHEFKTANCHLQVNLLSLAGYYGKMQKKLGIYLLKNNLVDYLGSDLHNLSQLKALKNLLKDHKMMDLICRNEYKNKLLLV